MHALIAWCPVVGFMLLCWPLVSTLSAVQGPYVLVLVAMGAAGFGPEDERRSRLPAMWLIKCYARLTRPYKKNVGPHFVSGTVGPG